MIFRLGYSQWIFLPTGRSWHICWMLKILMWFSQQAFPDVFSSQQEVESHTSMAQSFKCDQGRAQENISLLNIEQHCLVVWYLGWSWYLWYMIPGAVKRWLNAEEQLRKPENLISSFEGLCSVSSALPDTAGQECRRKVRAALVVFSVFGPCSHPFFLRYNMFSLCLFFLASQKLSTINKGL